LLLRSQGESDAEQTGASDGLKEMAALQGHGKPLANSKSYLKSAFTVRTARISYAGGCPV